MHWSSFAVWSVQGGACQINRCIGNNQHAFETGLIVQVHLEMLQIPSAPQGIKWDGCQRMELCDFIKRPGMPPARSALMSILNGPCCATKVAHWAFRPRPVSLAFHSTVHASHQCARCTEAQIRLVHIVQAHCLRLKATLCSHEEHSK